MYNKVTIKYYSTDYTEITGILGLKDRKPSPNTAMPMENEKIFVYLGLYISLTYFFFSIYKSLENLICLYFSPGTNRKTLIAHPFQIFISGFNSVQKSLDILT